MIDPATRPAATPGGGASACGASVKTPVSYIHGRTAPGTYPLGELVTDDVSPIDLEQTKQEFVRAANFAYSKLRTDHHKPRHQARSFNLVFCPDPQLNKTVREIWQILAEIALVDRLMRSDVALRKAMRLRQAKMRQLAAEVTRQIVTYADEHPELELDTTEFTREWATFHGTKPDIHIPDRLERFLAQITGTFRQIRDWFSQ